MLDAPPGVDLPMGFDFDRPPVGGDQFAFTHTLYRWAGTKQGARLGRLHVVGTFVTGFGPRFSHSALMLFDAQAYLPGGSVIAEGYGGLTPTARRSSRCPSSAARASTPTFAGRSTYATLETAPSARRASRSVCCLSAGEGGAARPDSCRAGSERTALTALQNEGSRIFLGANSSVAGLDRASVVRANDRVKPCARNPSRGHENPQLISKGDASSSSPPRPESRSRSRLCPSSSPSAPGRAPTHVEPVVRAEA